MVERRGRKLTERQWDMVIREHITHAQNINKRRRKTDRVQKTQEKIINIKLWYNHCPIVPINI